MLKSLIHSNRTFVVATRYSSSTNSRSLAVTTGVYVCCVAGSQPPAAVSTEMVDDTETGAIQVTTARCPVVNPEPPGAAPQVVGPDEDDAEPVIRLRPEFNGTKCILLYK